MSSCEQEHVHHEGLHAVHLVKPASGIRIVHQGPWHLVLVSAIISAPCAGQCMRLTPGLSINQVDKVQAALALSSISYRVHAFASHAVCNREPHAFLGDNDINLRNWGVNLNLNLCNLCWRQIRAGLWASRPGQTSQPAELQAATDSARLSVHVQPSALCRWALDAQLRQPGTGSKGSRAPGLSRVLSKHSSNTACSVLSAGPSKRWWSELQQASP